MTWNPNDPHARRSVAGRAVLHAAIASSLAGGIALATGNEHHGDIAMGAGAALGAAHGARSARRHNAQTSAYEAEHGAGPTKRSVLGRTLLHGVIGGWGGAAVGALADHALGTSGASQALGTIGQLGGYIHGFRSSRKHNAMVEALAQARASKHTMGHAIQNAQFEAKHRRVHGRFQSK